MSTTVHREDVKALLRKRYGSIEAFQELKSLTRQAVRDLLRGKSNAAKAAVANEFGVEPEHLEITSGPVPLCGGHNKDEREAHCLSAGTK